jgi:hypothetical protein
MRILEGERKKETEKGKKKEQKKHWIKNGWKLTKFCKTHQVTDSFSTSDSKEDNIN